MLCSSRVYVTITLILLLSFCFNICFGQDALPGMIMTCSRPGYFALTFDDGPSPYTSDLLDILDSESVTATFFVLGIQVDNPSFSSVLNDTFARGHQIAVHTYDHPHINTLSPDQLRDQLMRTDQALRNSPISVSPNYMRPPFGECNAASQAIIQEMGYTIVQWNLDSNDWRYADTPELYSRVTKHFDDELAKAATPQKTTTDAKSFISLQHDIQQFSVQQTKQIIFNIKAKGYKFDTVANCIGNPKPYYRNAPDNGKGKLNNLGIATLNIPGTSALSSNLEKDGRVKGTGIRNVNSAATSTSTLHTKFNDYLSLSGLMMMTTMMFFVNL